MIGDTAAQPRRSASRRSRRPEGARRRCSPPTRRRSSPGRSSPRQQRPPPIWHDVATQPSRHSPTSCARARHVARDTSRGCGDRSMLRHARPGPTHSAPQHDGVREGGAFLSATNSIDYVLTFFGTLPRAAVADITAVRAPPHWRRMDCRHGRRAVPRCGIARSAARLRATSRRDRFTRRHGSIARWLGSDDAGPTPFQSLRIALDVVYLAPTGVPKASVQPHVITGHGAARTPLRYGPEAVTLVRRRSLDTTLVSFLLACPRRPVILMAKLDAGRSWRWRKRHHVTHTMLVQSSTAHHRRADSLVRPVRVSRQGLHGTPFAAAFERDVLARWPGGLISITA